MPALTLQPLIENAVRHGITKLVNGGVVSVRVHRNGTKFSLSVENESEFVVGVSEADFFRSGHALENIRERLRLAYGSHASIQISFLRFNVVTVTIQAPINQ